LFGLGTFVDRSVGLAAINVGKCFLNSITAHWYIIEALVAKPDIYIFIKKGQNVSSKKVKE